MIRLAVVGLGVIGSGVVRLAIERGDIEIVAAVVRKPDLNGVPARSLVAEAPPTLRLSTDAASAFASAKPEVVLVATRSTLPEVLPHLRTAAAAGAAVACTAEDLAYIRPEDSAVTAEIFGLAERHGVPIVPVGINPGFVLDLWPLTLASLASEVSSITAKRVVDVSAFGPAVRASLGIGYSPDQFDRALAAGTISGHRGFRESLRMMAGSLGRPLDRTDVSTTPIFAGAARPLPGGGIAVGQTSGVRQEATGQTDGSTWIRLSMLVSVALDEINEAPVDLVRIDGSTTLTATISPGVKAVTGTIARIVNSIPAIVRLGPGVHSSLAVGITPPRPVTPR